MPGSGVLESKALLGFLPKLCRRLLGEELKMPNIATWWCGQDAERDRVLRDLDRLAIAPAFNGQGAADERDAQAPARDASDLTDRPSATPS